MASSNLWHRHFTRTQEEDEDILADESFLAANFTDFFGRWLQTGRNADINTFDELLMHFWSWSP
jgi:hypothetical protein